MTTQSDEQEILRGYPVNKMQCDHEGCERTDTTPCVLHGWEKDEPDMVQYFCAAHAYENGFCWSCGGFWSGIESFDFNNPSELCENCRENESFDDEWQDEDFYDYMDDIP